jgi:putative peptidoglycan lipid II flippase
LSESKKAAKSVFIMVIFAFGSKILGFIREVLIAAKFGSGVETDTFFVALTATGLFTTMVIQSINTIMIPVLSEVETKEGKNGKKNHTNNLLNIVFFISLVIVILGWIIAPFIMKALAPGFEVGQFKLAVLMMRIGLPVILFASIVGVLRGYLQSELMFTESAASQFPFNFVYIFFLLCLSSIFGIKGLMITSVLAVGSQILIQIPGIRKTGYKYKFILDINDKYTKKIIYLIPPVLMSVAVNDLNKIIDRSLASTLVDGSISALNYANRLNSLILGIFITAITTVIFPMLSKEASKDNYSGLKKVVRYGINSILLITIPATVGMIVLAHPIVRIAFERGVFDPNATYMTTGALIFYSLGLVGMALKLFLDKVYYSLQDTKTPMLNSFIAIGFNIVLNFILIKFMEHKGLALATSISTTITTGLMLYGLRKRIGSIETMRLIKCGLKSLIASIVMGAVAYLVYNTLDKLIGDSILVDLIVLLTSAGLGALIYVVLIYLFRVEEIDWAIGLIKNRISNKTVNQKN